MRTGKLIVVGYETKPQTDVVSFQPAFEPRKGTVKPELQLQQINEKMAGWAEEARNAVWLSTLSKIVLAIPETGVLNVLKFATGAAGPAAVACIKALEGIFRDYFRPDGTAHENPVRVFGFDARRFVKLLATEGAQCNLKVPHEFWYGADHRDAWEAMLPATESKGVIAKAPLLRMNIEFFKSAVDNYEPGRDALEDVYVAVQIAERLNLFPGFITGQSVQQADFAKAAKAKQPAVENQPLTTRVITPGKPVTKKIKA